MKTAVVCWGLLSIAFAFPTAERPHAGPLKKLEIQRKESHFVSSDTKARRGTLSAVVKDEEAAKPDSFSSNGNDDKAQKEASHLMSSDAKAQESTLSAEGKDEEAAKPDSFSSDGNDDKAQKDVPVQHAEAQEAAQYTWISADNHEYKQLERRAFSTLDLISPTARDDSSLQENLVAPTASDDSSLQEDLISPTARDDSSLQEDVISPTARDDSSLEEDLISPTAHDDSSPQEDLIPPTARDDSSLEENLISPTARDDSSPQEDLISPIASDDNNLREVSYASDDSENAFAPMSDRAFDDGYAGNDPEADAEFADDSLENVLASVDIENEPLTPIA